LIHERPGPQRKYAAPIDGDGRFERSCAWRLLNSAIRIDGSQTSVCFSRLMENHDRRWSLYIQNRPEEVVKLKTGGRTAGRHRKRKPRLLIGDEPGACAVNSTLEDQQVNVDREGWMCDHEVAVPGGSERRHCTHSKAATVEPSLKPESGWACGAERHAQS